MSTAPLYMDFDFDRDRYNTTCRTLAGCITLFVSLAAVVAIALLDFAIEAVGIALIVLIVSYYFTLVVTRHCAVFVEKYADWRITELAVMWSLVGLITACIISVIYALTPWGDFTLKNLVSFAAVGSASGIIYVFSMKFGFYLLNE